jgi:hypothetical protein
MQSGNCHRGHSCFYDMHTPEFHIDFMSINMVCFDYTAGEMFRTTKINHNTNVTVMILITNNRINWNCTQ